MSYFLAPFDIVPEAVFGLFGFIDDLLVGFFMIIVMVHILRAGIANAGGGGDVGGAVGN